MSNDLSRRQILKMTAGFVAGTTIAVLPSYTAWSSSQSVGGGGDGGGGGGSSTTGSGSQTTRNIVAPNGILASSADTPALAVFNNLLYVAWKGTDSANRIHIVSSADGAYFGSETVLSNEDSENAPALVVFNNQLYIAWTGTDSNRRINIAPYNGNSNVSRWARKKSAMLRYINAENASTRWFVYGRTFKGIFDS